uniref:GBS Bsp-like repeat-containing protein n=1 Tax=Christensenella intestinihominis TaxID=1851429 RepID=UPI000AC1ED29
ISGSNNWAAVFSLADFGYAEGTYHFNSYGIDRLGNSGVMKSGTYTVKTDKTPPTASATFASYDQPSGKFTVSTDNVNDPSGVSTVQLAVWNDKTGISGAKWYNARNISGSNNWAAVFSLADFGYAEGTYHFNSYGIDRLGNSGVMKSGTYKISKEDVTSKCQALFASPYVAGDGFTISADGVTSPHSVKKVQFAVWSAAEGVNQAKWYDATKMSGTNNWYAQISLSKHNNYYGDYYYNVYVLDGAGNYVTAKANSINMPLPGTNYKIMGNSGVTVNQLTNYYVRCVGINAFPQSYADLLAPTVADATQKRYAALEAFAQYYIEECNAEGVKVDVAWAQMCHETNYLKFTGDVNVNQFNFAGLGATGNGVKGFDFAATYGNNTNGIRMGIRAQIQHLKCYASTAALANPCVDPRWNNVTSAYGRGSAPTVGGLSQKWASNDTYGAKIMVMIQSLLQTADVRPFELTANFSLMPDMMLPDASPSASPDANPSASPDASPSVSPDASPSASPDASPSASPDASPSASPDASPSASPDASPSVSPDANPSASPDANPSASPDANPSVSPDANPSVSPDAA